MNFLAVAQFYGDLDHDVDPEILKGIVTMTG